ncbi:uncharacterized protein BJ212DRAFT_1303554 [Suillus subaureus]|uniref:Uncharacterized protein n=1 Tax=Suillus subaureus TaxID=48587 RepID=A0A9P7DZV8_9AGAM|nr:uncharacterized protein BJ212DRAFT_1303554 [Suillus subaureus]KAG1807348.1 hypothetical protein BJ212DRAFT_1303554 [Suillus subaureus]
MLTHTWTSVLTLLLWNFSRPTINDTQAAALLQTFWIATNAALKLQWQQQLAADKLIAAERRRLLIEEDAQCLLAQQINDTAIAAEEKKKNCIHHIPIPDRPRPQCNAAKSVLISDFALCKLDKAQFVELYYWMNRGLAAAHLNYCTLDDDSLMPTAGADSSTTWTSASASWPTAGVIADHLLSTVDFSRAVPCFITSLQERGWVNSCIVMLANFFMALMMMFLNSAPFSPTRKNNVGLGIKPYPSQMAPGTSPF